jgi:hypothetical protein
MNIPIDTINVTNDLTSAIDWDVVMKVVTLRTWTYICDPDMLPVITVERHLRDALLEGWASAYLRTHLSRDLPRGGDNLRTRLVKWVARLLGVSVSSSEQYESSVSQEAIQRLRDTMEEKGSLIVSGVWVKLTSF